jgi:predicted dehydrogenase
MTRLNVAIVGCGDISGAHLRAYRFHAERVCVAACCDTVRERAEKAATQAGGDTPQIVTDYAALLADPDIDAVDLCLPHHLHAAATLAAAKAGKAILCEKPLARNPEECDTMILTAREAGVTLMHGEPMRTAGNVEQAAALVREGVIGNLVGLQAAFAYWQRAELNREWRGSAAESGGGHLMDGGIHIVDVLRQVGGEVAAVHAMTNELRPELGVGCEDIAILNLRYAAGPLGQLFACHAARGRGAAPLLTVFGTEGCLTLDAYGEGRGLVLFRPGQPEEVVNTEHSWHHGYERLIGHFLDVVQQGVPLRATPEDGRENVRLILAAYESARTGREVAVNPAL